MRTSSLQLETSAITRLKIEANRDFPRENAQEQFRDFAGAGLKSSLGWERLEEDSRRYTVKLEIALLGSDASPTPYLIDIEMLGLFECSGDDPQQDETWVGANAPAVLYGSIRELVMQLTSRGPFPAIVLPTVNFVPPETNCDPDGKPAASEDRLGS